jgi:hypothetical protein
VAVQGTFIGLWRTLMTTVALFYFITVPYIYAFLRTGELSDLEPLVCLIFFFLTLSIIIAASVLSRRDEYPDSEADV